MIRYPIVSFGGVKGVGKNTVATMVRAFLEAGGVKVYETSFAYPLKIFVSKSCGIPESVMFGNSKERDSFVVNDFSSTRLLADIEREFNLAAPCDGEQAKWAQSVLNLPPNPTCRQLLQIVGTDVVRGNTPDYWWRATLDLAQKELVSGAGVVLVTDQRFRNEILGVKGAGGYCVKVFREKAGQGDGHVSETEFATIPDFWFDAQINNSSDIESLKGRAWLLANEIKRPNIIGPAMDSYGH